MGGVAKTPGQELCSLLRPHEGNPEPGDMALLGLSSPPDAGLHVIHEDMQTRCDDPHFAGERAEALQGQTLCPKARERAHTPKPCVSDPRSVCSPLFYFVQLLVGVLESCPFSGRSVHAEGQQPPGQPMPGCSGGLTPGDGPKGTRHPRSWLFLCLAFGPSGPVFISLPWPNISPWASYFLKQL